MIICIDCRPETKRHLDSLIANGQFADYSEAIAAAVANQVVLADRVSKSGALLFEEGGAESLENPTYPRGTRRMALNPPSPRLSSQGDSPNGVPDIFALKDPGNVTLDFASPPRDGWDGGSDVPATSWLWGQFNRFLPAKVSCRALANLQLKAPSGVLLSYASSQIAESAAKLGDFLVAHDHNQRLKKDEATATAFPHHGPNLWKAQQRYASQFVGSINGAGAVSGMLFDLKLINCDEAKEGPRIRLTRVGWKLAQLWNPILDSRTSEPGVRLSEEETRLLADHIRGAVWREEFAYCFLMRAIDGGATKPDALDEVVAEANAGMSAAFVSTQRSGAVSRMSDLGLLVRVRLCLTVTYAISDSGRRHLEGK